MAPPNGLSNSRQIFLYLGLLTLLVSVARPYVSLFGIPVSYMLKNQLHETATQVSTFCLLASIPIYLAFVFGLMRDLWNPLGWRDRGFFLLFAPIAAITFAWMALSRLSNQGLLISVLFAMLSYQFICGRPIGVDLPPRPRKAYVRAPERAVADYQHCTCGCSGIRFRIRNRASAAQSNLFPNGGTHFTDCLDGSLKAPAGLQ